MTTFILILILLIVLAMNPGILISFLGFIIVMGIFAFVFTMVFAISGAVFVFGGFLLVCSALFYLGRRMMGKSEELDSKGREHKVNLRKEGDK